MKMLVNAKRTMTDLALKKVSLDEKVSHGPCVKRLRGLPSKEQLKMHAWVDSSVKNSISLI